MTGLISVITPFYAPTATHVRATYESLSSQALPDSWEWEWVIQEDGTAGAAQELLPADDRVRIGGGRPGGVALTRNLALARSRGSLIRNLDQDDILLPGALTRDVTTLATHPAVGWVTSGVLDLLPDGSTVGFDGAPEPGELAPGVVFEHWRRHDFRLPVHPTSLCIRRWLAVALGGWMAVPGSDDTGLLIAASVVSTGYFQPEVGLLYRKWDGQESAGAAHREPTEWKLRMSLIQERAESLTTLWGHCRSPGSADTCAG